MTTMKKWVTLLLAALMLLSLTVVAGAEGEGDKYTISAPANSTHTYEVYQIFTGDLTKNEAGDDVLSNVLWGENGTGEKDAPVDENILNELKNTTGTDQEKLGVIVPYVNLHSEPYITITNNPIQVPGGYYLIKDVDGEFDDKNDSYTTYLVKVVKDITITPKASIPTMSKKVQDHDDEKWQDSADWAIGDDVPFCLTGTVAKNYGDYTVYKFVFHDKLSSGLSFDGDVKVSVDGEEITSGYEVKRTDFSDGCTFEIVFANLKSIQNVNAESEITVEYTAKLTEDAEIGSVGNPNEARLEFSNNPNDKTGEETGMTLWDKVTVFTYQLNVEKTDGENLPLEGASFKLYKKNNVGNYELVGSEVKTEKNEADGKYIASWKGLDDGDYKLEETVTPDGYNTIAPIEFTISAEHEEEAEDPTLITLSGDATSGGVTFTSDNTNGTLTTTVVNKSGATLPETGGIGTTIFYVAGGVLVLLAVVLLVTKRRVGEGN